MRARGSGACLRLGFGLVAACAACHNGQLIGLRGSVAFSSPDQPSAVTQPDAGLVQIDFGQVMVGGTRSLTLAFASLGTTVTLGALTAVQPDPEFSLPFVEGTIVNSTPSQITASFSPTSLGQKSAVYQLADLAPAAGSVTLALTGLGVPNGLTVSPNPVDFGEVELNQTQSVPVTITNNSGLTANLLVGSPQGPDAKLFTVGAPSSTTLAPNASTTLDAVFAPLVAGDAGASFTVEGWDSARVTVNLTGIGAQSWIQIVSPLDFGFVQLGSTVVKSAQIKNIGSYTTVHLVAPAPIVSQTVGSTAFSLASGQPTLPLAIAPGQSALIPVAFAPASLDALTGTLFVTTDDPGAQYPAIQLEGYGGGPRIQCQPQLSFGPTPVGYPFPAPTLCTNTGANIPAHPELNLQIAQRGLTSDAPFFSARLSLPDVGLAGPGDSVALSSGQSAIIEVSFEPPDGGIYEGRLGVASNDVDDADAGTLLTGQECVPGPCTLEALPNELSFGDVPPGGVGTQQFELQNTGQNLCVLAHIAVDPKSDPGFSLPQGDLVDQLLSYPGDPVNPAGRPTVLGIPVQFASSGLSTAAAGTLDITAPNASPPELTVSLTATSAYGCFTVEPKSYDFGTLVFSPVTQQPCTPASTTFTGDERLRSSRFRLPDRARPRCGWWRSVRLHLGFVWKLASVHRRSRRPADVRGRIHTVQSGARIRIPAGDQQRLADCAGCRRNARGGRRSGRPSHRHLQRSGAAQDAGPGVDPRQRRRPGSGTERDGSVAAIGRHAEQGPDRLADGGHLDRHL